MCLRALALLILTFGASNAETIGLTIETQAGNIEIELYPDKAPATVSNFLKYVDAGLFNGGQFHRTVTMNNQPDSAVKIEVIQASVRRESEKKEFPPILLERTSKTG